MVGMHCDQLDRSGLPRIVYIVGNEPTGSSSTSTTRAVYRPEFSHRVFTPWVSGSYIRLSLSSHRTNAFHKLRLKVACDEQMVLLAYVHSSVSF